MPLAKQLPRQLDLQLGRADRRNLHQTISARFAKHIETWCTQVHDAWTFSSVGVGLLFLSRYP